MKLLLVNVWEDKRSVDIYDSKIKGRSSELLENILSGLPSQNNRKIQKKFCENI